MFNANIYIKKDTMQYIVLKIFILTFLQHIEILKEGILR